MKHNFTCNKNNQRLTEFLSDSLEFVNKNVIKRQIKTGEVRVNGVKTREDAVLTEGDEVSVFLPEKSEGGDFTPDVIYEDTNILIIYKPAGCDVENHLVKLLSVGRSFLKPLHRLDRNTDGILVFALSETAYSGLMQAFKSRSVEKCYYALVYGVPKKKSAVLEDYLVKDEKTYKSLVYPQMRAGGVKIVTEYETVDTFGGFSLLRVKPVTGKTHQIRAHLAFIGNAVLGDGKYAPKSALKEFSFSRQQLTAYSICFSCLSGELAYLNGQTFKLRTVPFSGITRE